MQFIDSLIPPVLREDMLPAEPSTTGDSVIDVRPTPKGTDTHTHTHTQTHALLPTLWLMLVISPCV